MNKQVVLNEAQARALVNIDGQRIARIAELERTLDQIRVLCGKSEAHYGDRTVQEIRALLDGSSS